MTNAVEARLRNAAARKAKEEERKMIRETIKGECLALLANPCLKAGERLQAVRILYEVTNGKELL